MCDLITNKRDFPLGFRGDKKPSPLEAGELTQLLEEAFVKSIRFNLLTLYCEQNEQAIPAHELESLYISLSEKGWKIDKTKAIDSLMTHARRNSYHPITEYLDYIEKDDNVKPIEIGKLATNYLGTTDPLYDLMLRQTVIGAVARIMNPGCKFDTCTVLLGHQGIGKSTFWKTLAFPAWFADTPQEKDQDLRLLIQTCWIYELAELETTTSKKAAGALKGMLSSSVDKFRAPYAKGVEDRPRPSIIVGSCNSKDFLRDDTGSRRYWVIHLPQKPGEKLKTEKLRLDRDGIWKGALAAYKNGDLPFLSQEWEHQSTIRNQDFEPEDPWLEPIQLWLKRENHGEFTTNQALLGSGLRQIDQLRNSDARDAARVLRALGYECRQRRTGSGSGRVRIWQKVDTGVTGEIHTAVTSQNTCSAIDPGGLSHVTADF